MSIGYRETVQVFRKDPMQLRLSVVGIDLTGASMQFAVRLYPNAAGDPLVFLSDTTTSGADGIRFIEVMEDDGVPISVVEVKAGKPLIQDLPANGVAMEEAGEPVRLYYDLQWHLPFAEVAPFSVVEETVIHGEFVVMGSVNA